MGMYVYHIYAVPTEARVLGLVRLELRDLRASIRVLGIEPESSGRAAIA